MEFTTADNDLAQDVVLLSDGDDAGGLAEDVLHNLSASFDPLTVSDHQQRDVLVDLMGLLRDPEQGSTFVDLVAVLGRAGFLDGKARGELDQTAGSRSETIVGQFCNHLTRADLAAGDGVEAITGTVLGLQIPDFT